MTTRLILYSLVSIGASGCVTANVSADGDHQVLTWNRLLANPRACALVQSELQQSTSAPQNIEDKKIQGEDGERIKILQEDLRAYRACEAYANGALTEDESRKAVLDTKALTTEKGEK
jgi:hypothetical protein